MKMNMDQYLRDRFSRQLLLPEFNRESQERLSSSKVLVVGAGGLGCPVLMYLAAAGIVNLDVADGDKVEISNLHRQVLFGMNDTGRNKAVVASEMIRSRFPEIKSRAIPMMINQTNALDLFKPYDLIIDGTDNFQSRYLINDACVLLKKPLLYGAVNGFEGQLALFHPGSDINGVCYRDLFSVPPPEGSVYNCNGNGVLGTVPGITGVMMANEAIKFLAGLKVTPGRLLVFNSLNMVFHEIEITRDHAKRQPANPMAFMAYDYHTFCGVSADIMEVTFEELSNWWQHDPQEMCIIDVRERQEISNPLMPGIINRPASEWDLSLEGIETKQRVILLCQSGVRSNRLGIQLKKLHPELKVYSLKGGVSGLKISMV